MEGPFPGRTAAGKFGPHISHCRIIPLAQVSPGCLPRQFGIVINSGGLHGLAPATKPVAPRVMQVSVRPPYPPEREPD